MFIWSTAPTDDEFEFESDVSKEAFYLSYVHDMQGSGYNRPLSVIQFWKKLKHHGVKYKEVRKNHNGVRQRCVQFAHLDECRKDYEERTRTKPVWREVQDEEVNDNELSVLDLLDQD